MEQLIIRNSKITTTIPIRSKFTVLRGDSGIGKSTLVRDIEARASTVSFRYPIYLLRDILINLKSSLENIYKANGIHLVIGDEDLDYLYNKEFQKIIMESPHLFLLVARYNFSSIPYSYKDIVTLENQGKKNIGVPMLTPTDGAGFRNIKQL